MRYNADLYELIKSLSKAEKRYFKLYTAQHTKKEHNNYILLFDAMDRQDQYNEEKLRQKFRKHTFSKNIAKTKYLLYELIIKMLRQMHCSKSTDSKIKIHIEAADYLYSKSLYDQAYSSLQKAKKLVAFYEHYEFWLQILEREGGLAGKLKKSQTSGSLAMIEEYRRVKAFSSLELDYKVILYEIQLYTQLSDQGSFEVPANYFEKLIDSKIITEGESLAKTFLSKACLLEILVLYALAVHDLESAFYNLEKLNQHWNDNPRKNEIFKEHYIRFCTNYMRCCTHAKRKGQHYDKLLLSLQYLHTSNPQEADRNFLLASVYDFNFNLTNNNLEVCAVQIFTIKDLIEGHKEKLDEYSLINLFYHISVFYFLRGEFNETLFWIDKIQNLDTKNTFLNIQNYCRLLSLMAKYGENEFEVLEYDIRKVHRFLSNGKPVKPMEKLILTKVRQLLNVKHAKEETTVFAELYSELHRHHQNNQYPLTRLTASHAIYQWIRNKLPKEEQSLFN